MKRKYHCTYIAISNPLARLLKIITLSPPYIHYIHISPWHVPLRVMAITTNPLSRAKGKTKIF